MSNTTPDQSRTPELPEPAFQLRWKREQGQYYVSKPNIGDTDVYTADQLREYGRACVAAAMAPPPDVQEAEPVADDWYTMETGSLAVDWSHDLSRQLSLILKKDGTVAYAAFIDGKKLHGANAMTPEFYDVLRELVAQPSGDAEDARRLDFLDSYAESYGFEGEHLGNSWLIQGAYANIRAAIDHERSPLVDAMLAKGVGGD